MQEKVEGIAGGTSALKAVLSALEDPQVPARAPVELLIRVKGKEDRTLKITLQNVQEMREILKRSIGLD